jgi:hypothetical protein
MRGDLAHLPRCRDVVNHWSAERITNEASESYIQETMDYTLHVHAVSRGFRKRGWYAHDASIIIIIIDIAAALIQHHSGFGAMKSGKPHEGMCCWLMQSFGKGAQDLCVS